MHPAQIHLAGRGILGIQSFNSSINASRIPNSAEKASALKARLSDVAHSYCGCPIDPGDFAMTKDCFLALKSLWSIPNIDITEPDKGSGVVILKKYDYISKMESILNDTSKFVRNGSVGEFDNTAKIEARMQRRVLEFRKKKTYFIR